MNDLATKEEWKDIKGFTGYQISNLGRVRSFHRFNAGRVHGNDVLINTPHLMDIENSDDGSGYKKVMLRHDGKSFCRKIHRLVAEAFIPNPNNYDTVDHISNDKSDNSISNLQWLSRKDNLLKAYNDGIHNDRIEKSKIKVILSNDDGEILRFDSVGEAADYLGVHYTSISHAYADNKAIRGYWVSYGNGGKSKMQEIINKFPGYKYVVEKDKMGIVHRHNMYRGVDLGFGGYTYVEEGIYNNVVLIDIQSMHPSSIVAMNYFGEYTPRFKEILDARIAIKNGDFDKARKMFDGKLAKYLDDTSNADALAQALKIAINSVYGLTSASFENPMRDSRNINNIVALRGALFMKTLLDDLQAQGIQVCHLKVDSMKIPNGTPEIIQYCQDFAAKYGYNFAHEATYERICIVDKSNYIASYMSEEECNKRYGYVPSDNRKHFKKHAHPWTETGANFQHPYVFKTLFSGEPVVFEDMCETKSVKDAAIYLDFNESLPDVKKYEKEYVNRIFNRENADIRDPNLFPKKLNAELHEYTDEQLIDAFSKGHDYRFVGRVGRFFPVRNGANGGNMLSFRNGKYGFINGTKGHRWLESAVVKANHLEDECDHSYFDNLISKAISAVNRLGSFDRFIDLTRPYEPPDDISPAADDNPPWVIVPCGDGKYASCMDCPNYDGSDRCGLGYSLATYVNEGGEK